jgi:hypothetical protein
MIFNTVGPLLHRTRAIGGGNPNYDIPQLLSMYKAGKLNLDDMITRQYKLEQINDGCRDMLEGRNIRSKSPCSRPNTRPWRQPGGRSSQFGPGGPEGWRRTNEPMNQ